MLGQGVVDPAAALVDPADLGVIRGDAVFETIRLADGRLDAEEAHLKRLVRSAEMLDLPAPDAAACGALLASAGAAWGDRGEASVRLVYTRGDGTTPTCFVVVEPIPEHIYGQRRDGLRVVTLDRGLPADAGNGRPWLLVGAKTTSYAVNMAAVRVAKSRSADDAIFVSTGGEVLEGPTATVVWARDGVLHTPPVEVGILAGTTVQTVWRNAAVHGLGTAYTRASVHDLHAADGVWLVSSVRGAVTVVAIDGIGRGDSGVTAKVQSAAGL